MWSLPQVAPPLFGAAVTPATAAWVASWADGLITINQPLDVLREVLEAFRAEGGAHKPVRLQVHVPWADTDQEALRIAHEQWAPVISGGPLGWELVLPGDFEQFAAYVRPDDMHPHVLASCEPARHVDWLTPLADLGFDEVYVHHVGQSQQKFPDVHGNTVLPAWGTPDLSADRRPCAAVEHPRNADLATGPAGDVEQLACSPRKLAGSSSNGRRARAAGPRSGLW